ncbi:MAG: 3-hydroxyacyl-CoA dehydrogenase family protein [Acidobacteria bacterium]|nr:3-hydroxyacyl-CoA dehydrogenase family protein [Acidobacteriota bacterium]
MFAKAAVIGTGMMGPGIAMTLALGGVEPVILGRTEESAAKGLEYAHRALELLRANGLAGEAAPIRASAKFDEAVAAADLVVESAPEDMAFKQDLFLRLEAVAKPDAVLASNTSGLSITAIGEKCARRHRILTTHFWNPPHLVPLVEVVMSPFTDLAVAQTVHGLLARCGKVPVLVKKDTPGQLGNRMQMALVREAAHIVREGIADAEAVDLAARMGFGIRLPAYGILEHQDIVGLPMCAGILEYVASDVYNGTEAKAHRELIAQGHTGAAAGRGFHEWPAGKAGEVRARRDGFVMQVLKWWKATS